MSIIPFDEEDDGEDVTANPLDLVEQIVVANEWAYDRSSESSLVVEIAGQWAEYRLFFSWRNELSVMQFCCAADVRVPPARRAAVQELLMLANEKLWIGHFGASFTDNLLTFRHATLLRGAASASVEQLEDLVDIALAEFDRFYPAFQFVVWGGKNAVDALSLAVLEPVGEA